MGDANRLRFPLEPVLELDNDRKSSNDLIRLSGPGGYKISVGDNGECSIIPSAAAPATAFALITPITVPIFATVSYLTKMQKTLLIF